jgi:hypothetical protein
MTTATSTLASWIQDNISKDDAQRWFPLTFRVDSAVVNGAKIAQSPWSRSSTYAFQKVTRALDWTVTELRRYHKELQFVSYMGGDEAVGVRTHIHAIVRVPDGQDLAVFAGRLQSLWSRNLAKTLKAQVKASVWMGPQPVESAHAFSFYSSRLEDESFGRGTSKVLIGKSFYLEPRAT